MHKINIKIMRNRLHSLLTAFDTLVLCVSVCVSSHLIINPKFELNIWKL